MRRIVYYIISCTPEENQNGTFHYSKPFSDKKEALKLGRKLRKEKGDNFFVTIDESHELFEHHDWHTEKTEMIAYL